MIEILILLIVFSVAIAWAYTIGKHQGHKEAQIEKASKRYEADFCAPGKIDRLA